MVFLDPKKHFWLCIQKERDRENEKYLLSKKHLIMRNSEKYQMLDSILFLYKLFTKKNHEDCMDIYIDCINIYVFIPSICFNFIYKLFFSHTHEHAKKSLQMLWKLERRNKETPINWERMEDSPFTNFVDKTILRYTKFG